MYGFLFLALLSWALVVIAVILMTGAYRKFLGGQFKSMLGWILLGLWFMAVPYTAFILQDAGFLDAFGEKISYFIYIFMILVALFLVKGALSLVEFSKVYGFADVKEKMEEMRKGKIKKPKK